MSTSHTTHPTVDALAALLRDDRPAALYATRVPDKRHPLLSTQLRSYLSGESASAVYEEPSAFQAFIDGGGNVDLYKSVSAALAHGYGGPGSVGRLLDIGCGDGHALLPALHAAPGRVTSLTLVEPSMALLDTAVTRLRQQLPELAVRAFNDDLQTYLGRDSARFDVVQSTFALHTVPTEVRTELLAMLAGRTRRLQIVEFDHTRRAPGSVEHLHFLADSYERGLGEYDTDRTLVAQGFLMKVLAGQLDPRAPRFTWEQPAHRWREQVAAAGFEHVTVEPLCDYWSSPAFLLTAEGAGAFATQPR